MGCFFVCMRVFFTGGTGTMIVFSFCSGRGMNRVVILCGCFYSGRGCFRGEGGCVYEKSAGDFRLRRSRGRLPTLPLAQYHRRDQV